MAYWIEYFASLNLNESMAWRTPLALQLVFILIIGAGISFFPESPRWLMKMGRYEEARDILQATRSGDIEMEAKQIMQAVQYELKMSSANQYLTMIFPRDKYTRALRWRVFLAVWLQIMQELVGIGVITVYAVDLFSTAGFDENLSKLLAGFNNISYIYVFSLFRGRHPGSLRTPANHGLGRCRHGPYPTSGRYSGHVCPRSRTKPKEIRIWCRSDDLLLHSHVWRDLANHAIALSNRDFPTYRACEGRRVVCTRMVNRKQRGDHDYPFLFQAIGYGTLLLLCGLNFFVIPFLLILYPETAGRSLEQMDVFFDNADT
ncbi:hypothetical protein SI65_04398 [Aspergillus cristatus]|uniref:Major facilitator superfamily (MFS) profile domain-containing protein n=1 Tax=Aspergillus cristatus TaxID=573508 RepID=A0A1E3BEN1_ASPCR|nr:hypothetical protein SI65_04398 [Aspergillus cristatus]